MIVVLALLLPLPALALSPATILFSDQATYDGLRGPRDVTTSFCRTRELYAALNCTDAAAFLSYRDDSVVDFPARYGLNASDVVSGFTAQVIATNWTALFSEPLLQTFSEGVVVPPGATFWTGSLANGSSSRSRCSDWSSTSACLNGMSGDSDAHTIEQRAKSCNSARYVVCVCFGGGTTTTQSPTAFPSNAPNTANPSVRPTTARPSIRPSATPSLRPSHAPSTRPSLAPSIAPSVYATILYYAGASAGDFGPSYRRRLSQRRRLATPNCAALASAKFLSCTSTHLFTSERNATHTVHLRDKVPYPYNYERLVGSADASPHTFAQVALNWEVVMSGSSSPGLITTTVEQALFPTPSPTTGTEVWTGSNTTGHYDASTDQCGSVVSWTDATPFLFTGARGATASTTPASLLGGVSAFCQGVRSLLCVCVHGLRLGTTSPTAAPSALNKVIVYNAYAAPSTAPTGAFGVAAANATCAARKVSLGLTNCVESDVLVARTGVSFVDYPATLNFDANGISVTGPTGIEIATSWTNFLAGILTNTISVAVPGVSGVAWWSGSTSGGGGVDPDTCTDWSSAAGLGAVGSMTGTGGAVTRLTTGACANPFTVLCVCAPAPTSSPSAAPTTPTTFSPSAAPTSSKPSVRPSAAPTSAKPSRAPTPPTPPTTSPTAAPTHSPGVYLFRYDDATVTGNLGGITAADAVCQSRISTYGLNCGTARLAVQSTTNTLLGLQSAYGFSSSEAVKGPTGITVAPNWAAFTDVNVPTPATGTTLQLAGVVPTASTWWTGVPTPSPPSPAPSPTPAPLAPTTTCADWTTTGGSGLLGFTNGADWSRTTGASSVCSNAFWAICVCY